MARSDGCLKLAARLQYLIRKKEGRLCGLAHSGCYKSDPVLPGTLIGNRSQELVVLVEFK